MRNWAQRRRITTPTGAPPPGSAAFPSRLRTSGRTIVDANGATMPVLRGFNIHAVPFSQATFNEIYTEGGRFLRIIARWDDFEPTSGNITTAKRDALDLTMTRAAAAGLYCMIELHLISGGYPAWTTGTAEENRYTSHGQYITQYLANRYGNPSSPQYALNCVGFGLNEPPVTVAEANAGTGNPFMETVQRQLITWMRATGYAPSWIGFVSYAYSQATPIRITGYNSSMVEASPTAFDSVGGNVVIDVHDYFLRDTRATAPYDGRQYNGMPYSQSNGGPGVGVGEEHYTSTALKKAQQAAFMAPYKTFCTNANLPLMVGEWGWVQVLWSDGVTPVTGEQAYIDDKQLVWDDSGAAFRLHWNYDTTTNVGLNPWAARPGGTWRICIDDEMGGPPPPPPGGPPGGGTIVNDTFSGGVDQYVTAHTGETGATWANITDRIGHRVSTAGRVYVTRPGGSDDSWAYASGTPASAEYDVTADMHVVSTAAGSLGICAGMDTAAKTAYIVGYAAATGAWTLYKYVAGVSTTLGTFSGPITTGTSVAVILRRRATGLTVLIAGTSRITSSDVAITAVGKAGLWSYGTWLSTTGVHIDNFVATSA